jgi:hypothetical protein
MRSFGETDGGSDADRRFTSEANAEGARPAAAETAARDLKKSRRDEEDIRWEHVQSENWIEQGSVCAGCQGDGLLPFGSN